MEGETRRIKICHAQKPNNPNQCKYYKPQHVLRQTDMKKMIGESEGGAEVKKKPCNMYI